MPMVFQHSRILFRLLLVDVFRYMLHLPISLYDLYKYYSFSPQIFNAMKKNCVKGL